MWKSGEDLDGLQLLATKLVEPFTSFRCISVLFLPAVSPLLLPHYSIMLLAPQSGALRISAYRDFHPIPIHL